MAERFVLEQREGAALATIMARRGIGATAIGIALGGVLAEGPSWTQLGGVRLIGTGPGTWLAEAEEWTADWEEDLRRRLVGLASVSDQSGGYSLFRFRGSGARALLQRGLPIDLDPSVFKPGISAVSLIDHIGVTLWQLDDRPCYDLALFRSYTASFRRWVDATRASSRL